MPLVSTPDISGVLTLTVRDATGCPTRTVRVPNLVTSAGRALIAQCLVGVVGQSLDLFLAVGEGGDAASPADVDLQTRAAEVGAVASTIEALADDTGRVGVTIRGTARSTTARPLPVLREAGVRVAVPGTDERVLYNRATFDPVTVDPGSEVTLSWELIF